VWFRSGSLLFALSVLTAGCGRGGDVENPQPLYGDVPIAYPMDLWEADVEGQVLLRVRVTDMGGVDSVEVLESSGYPAFDSAAVHGALGLEYRPATRSGRRISVWAKVPVQFTKSQAEEGSP
jgi:protein TonB